MKKGNSDVLNNEIIQNYLIFYLLLYNLGYLLSRQTTHSTLAVCGNISKG